MGFSADCAFNGIRSGFGQGSTCPWEFYSEFDVWI